MNDYHQKACNNKTCKSTNHTKNYSFICKDFSCIFSRHSQSSHSSYFTNSFIQNHTISIRNSNHNNQKNYYQNYSSNYMHNVQNSLNLRNFIIKGFYTIFYTLPFILRLANINLLFNTLSNISRIGLHCFQTTCYINFRITFMILSDSCFNQISSQSLFILILQID